MKLFKILYGVIDLRIRIRQEGGDTA